MEKGKFRGSAQNSVAGGKLWALVICSSIVQQLSGENWFLKWILTTFSGWMHICMSSIKKARWSGCTMWSAHLPDVGHWARRWIDHWVRDAWQVRCQTYDYLSSHKASPPFDWYQIILLCEQRHRHVNNLPKVVTWQCIGRERHKNYQRKSDHSSETMKFSDNSTTFPWRFLALLTIMIGTQL